MFGFACDETPDLMPATLDYAHKILMKMAEDRHAGLAPFLERAGFHVLVVSDGVSALEKAQAHHPELIILDVLMPRMDGRETLRRLRKAKIWTPTILLTQVGEASERALALEEGADDYLNKPFDIPTMRTAVRPDPSA